MCLNGSANLPMNILIVSGLGEKYLSRIRREDDGRSDFLLHLFDYLSSIGVVNTSFKNCSRNDVDIEIHIDCQIPRTAAKKVLFYFEDTNVRPKNYLASYINYDKIFSIFNLNITGNQTTYLAYPHDLKIGEDIPSFSERSITASMLATNRNVIFNCSKSLYNQRQEVIQQFELTDNFDFRLFGKYWDKSFVKCGVMSRVQFELSKRLSFGSTVFTPSKKLKNWYGHASKKSEVLKTSKFNFCFENIYGLDGYISEKLLDSINFGSVPIYYPSYEIEKKFFPSELYYDYRDFENFESLIDFMENFDEGAYNNWRSLAQDFLPNLKKRHSIENFINRIDVELNNILNINI